jgi:pimeloyl-ACP methyl ester carboxylesterase
MNSLPPEACSFVRGPTVHVPGAHLTDYTFTLPLRHDDPRSETIEVFARAASAPDKPDEKRPWLVFLQGGPGFAAPRPINASGWLGRMLKEYRVLLLDQRGTGRSTPATLESILALGDAAAQADYLQHFRADAIVRDCEWIRRTLAGPDERWSVLGQSFGGFCATHYLCAHPEGLREVYITGGLPPLLASADDVYRRTYALCARKNREFYERYPQDVERVDRLLARIEREQPRLPNGDRLTADRLRQLGMEFGMQAGYGNVHGLLEEAEAGGREGPLPYAFLRHMEAAQSFDTNPLYALLHEACYAQGGATGWAAERVRAEFPAFADPAHRPVAFTGEMIYPWMFEDYARLAPLQGAAELLAQKNDWPALYDPAVLAKNEVPVAAAVYHDDMYVDRGYSRDTADVIPHCQLWITNEHEHCGLRVGGAALIEKLMDRIHGRV